MDGTPLAPEEARGQQREGFPVKYRNVSHRDIPLGCTESLGEQGIICLKQNERERKTS